MNQTIINNGKIEVNLEYKDCKCSNHIGPHWVYEQRNWKVSNEDLLRQHGYVLGGIQYLIAEKQRIAALLSIVKDLNLSSVPHYLL